MKTSEQITDIAAAMAKAQEALKPAHKDAENPHYHSRYADLASVWEAWRAAGPPNGLAAWQDVTTDEHGVSVVTRIVHISGQWYECGPLTVPLSRDDAHGVGSATTYAKRYSFSAAVGVVAEDEDDDGEAAIDRPPEERAKQQAACPECGKPGTIITGKAEYGGGFLCFKKRGGCGAKFLDDPRESQVDQATGEVIPPRRLEPIAKGYPKETPYDHSKEPDPAATPLDPPNEVKEDDRGYYVGAIVRHAKALKLTNAEKKALGDIHLKGAVAEHAPIEAVRALWQQLETFAHDPEAVKQWRSTATS